MRVVVEDLDIHLVVVMALVVLVVEEQQQDIHRGISHMDNQESLEQVEEAELVQLPVHQHHQTMVDQVVPVS